MTLDALSVRPSTQERLRELQRSMGLKTSHHVIATGIFALGQYLVNAGVFAATGAVAGGVLRTSARPTLNLLLLLSASV